MFYRLLDYSTANIAHSTFPKIYNMGTAFTFDMLTQKIKKSDR